ncbi:BPL-N domain-containing protein [Amycolatopsis sp. NPDC004378]
MWKRDPAHRQKRRAEQPGLHAWNVVLSRRQVMGSVCGLAGYAALTGCPASPEREARNPPREGYPGNLALVCRGPATDADCADALAGLLRDSTLELDVRFTGPREQIPISTETLGKAKIYAQPGGGDLREGYQHMQDYRDLIRAYVGGGGAYLGICLGGYLAGSDPGFDLLPVPVDQYITSPAATVRTEADTVVEVCWNDRQQFLYFQDGPVFLPGEAATDVVATYPSGLAAALIARYGRGLVAVSGPHVEATADWYEAYDLDQPEGDLRALGFDFVRRLVRT